MNEIYNDQSLSAWQKSYLWLDITAERAEGDLERAQLVLEHIRGGWQKAVGSALARAASAGKTEAKRAVTQEYTLSQSTFLRYTENVNHYDKKGGEYTGTVSFAYKGRVIPLKSFETKIDSSGRVVTNVKKSTGSHVLNHAFWAQVGDHGGYFERVGPKPYPITQLYGPATPQMMYSNETVTDAIEEKVFDTYEKRIDHEILRVLNGWGV